MNYKKIVDENMNDLMELLKIKSVYDENTACEEMPYGEEVYKAFVFMKNLAEKDGFIVKTYDNKALSISYNDLEKRIDIAGHLDVVSAKEEDFRIRIEEGKLFGRGTSDMKVPLFLNYLCLKQLRQEHPHINKQIRLVLGTDEERTMKDLDSYIEKEGYPLFAYTPDGQFPMGIGEKGAIMWTIKDKYQGKIKYLSGGSQCNIVAPYAKCVLEDISLLDKFLEAIKKYNIDGKAFIENGELFVETKGVACHASIPFFGRNATIDLLQLINEVIDDDAATNLYQVFSDYFGSGFNSFVSDDVMHCLTCNLGILEIKDGTIFGQVDCRYPLGKTSTELTNNLKVALKSNVTLDYNDDPTECKEDDVYVKTMLDTYRNITNDYSRPIVSGGVSYSKVFKHSVSYGVTTLSKPSLAHQDGEYVEVEDIYKWMEIYYKTLENLALLEE